MLVLIHASNSWMLMKAAKPCMSTFLLVTMKLNDRTQIVESNYGNRIKTKLDADFLNCLFDILHRPLLKKRQTASTRYNKFVTLCFFPA